MSIEDGGQGSIFSRVAFSSSLSDVFLFTNIISFQVALPPERLGIHIFSTGSRLAINTSSSLDLEFALLAVHASPLSVNFTSAQYGHFICFTERKSLLCDSVLVMLGLSRGRRVGSSAGSTNDSHSLPDGLL